MQSKEAGFLFGFFGRQPGFQGLSAVAGRLAQRACGGS